MLSWWKDAAVSAAKQGNTFIATRDGHHLLESSSSPAGTEAVSTPSPLQISQTQLANLHQSFLPWVKLRAKSRAVLASAVSSRWQVFCP